MLCNRISLYDISIRNATYISIIILNNTEKLKLLNACNHFYYKAYHTITHNRIIPL